jgi:hypothetical protein
MDPTQDREAFVKALRTQLEMPELNLEDLILTAKNTLEFVISPMAYEFLPLSKLPPDTELAGGEQEPLDYHYEGRIPHEHDQNDPHPGG